MRLALGQTLTPQTELLATLQPHEEAPVKPEMVHVTTQTTKEKKKPPKVVETIKATDMVIANTFKTPNPQHRISHR